MADCWEQQRAIGRQLTLNVNTSSSHEANMEEKLTLTAESLHHIMMIAAKTQHAHDLDCLKPGPLGVAANAIEFSAIENYIVHEVENGREIPNPNRLTDAQRMQQAMDLSDLLDPDSKAALQKSRMLARLEQQGVDVDPEGIVKGAFEAMRAAREENEERH